MKKASLLKQLIRLTGMLLGICDSHHSSLLTISATYRLRKREPSDSHDPADSIKIKPCGALYQLIHMNPHDDGVQGTAQWLATYPWNASGHGLFAQHRYWILDAVKKRLYPERYDKNHKLILKNL